MINIVGLLLDFWAAEHSLHPTVFFASKGDSWPRAKMAPYPSSSLFSFINIAVLLARETLDWMHLHSEGLLAKAGLHKWGIFPPPGAHPCSTSTRLRSQSSIHLHDVPLTCPTSHQTTKDAVQTLQTTKTLHFHQRILTLHQHQLARHSHHPLRQSWATVIQGSLQQTSLLQQLLLVMVQLAEIPLQHCSPPRQPLDQ